MPKITVDYKVKSKNLFLLWTTMLWSELRLDYRGHVLSTGPHYHLNSSTQKKNKVEKWWTSAQGLNNFRSVLPSKKGWCVCKNIYWIYKHPLLLLHHSGVGVKEQKKQWTWVRKAGLLASLHYTIRSAEWVWVLHSDPLSL